MVRSLQVILAAVRSPTAQHQRQCAQAAVASSQQEAAPLLWLSLVLAPVLERSGPCTLAAASTHSC